MTFPKAHPALIIKFQMIYLVNLQNTLLFITQFEIYSQKHIRQRLTYVLLNDKELSTVI